LIDTTHRPIELADVLDKVRVLAKSIVAQEAPEVNQEAKWPARSIKALQEAGLAGLVVPTAYGGLGLGLEALVQVCEILGEVCASTSMCFGMHCVGSAVISAKATAFQKEKYLRPIAEGRHITTLALSEPGTGAHFYYPQTQLLINEEGNFTVSGKKSFITNGGYADSYVVSTVGVEPEATAHQFSCIVLDNNMPGMQWDAPWNGMGMRGNSSRGLTLQGIQVPESHLLGEQGDQLWYIFSVVAPYFLMAMAGSYLGLSQAAFNEAQQHLIKRSYAHSGSMLGQVSVLQHRLGTLWAKVERTRRLIYHAAASGDSGDPAALPGILSAKAEVATCVVEVVNEAMTISGGMAYRDNSRFDVLLRDARAAHIMSPTTDILYTWLGRALLDQPILSD
jgi:alkylation response protein AidB-like acyl-CoA dehydrogenase